MFVVLGSEHMPIKRQPGPEEFIDFSLAMERQKEGEDKHHYLYFARQGTEAERVNIFLAYRLISFKWQVPGGTETTDSFQVITNQSWGTGADLWLLTEQIHQLHLSNCELWEIFQSAFERWS